MAYRPGGGAHAGGPRRAGDAAPSTDQANCGRGRPLRCRVAPSPTPGLALPRPVGDAPRGRGARLVPVRRRAHAHRLWRPSPNESAAHAGKRRTAVRVPLSGQGSHAGAAARAARDLRQGPGPGPDQLGASRCTARGCPAARCRRRHARGAADRAPARRRAPQGVRLRAPWLQARHDRGAPHGAAGQRCGVRRRGRARRDEEAVRASRAQLPTPGGLTRLSSSPTDGCLHRRLGPASGPMALGAVRFRRRALVAAHPT